jgi:hypothetical protein
MLTQRIVAWALGLALSGFLACATEEVDPRRNRTMDDADAGEQLGNVPFEPVGPLVYVPKVKNLLTGLAATDEEVKAVTADPNALRGLIDQWMTLPSFKVRMLDFFRNAFQQNNVDTTTLEANLRLPNINFAADADAQLRRNLMDSFGLTAWQLMEESKPFAETVTTRRYMMTTALLGTIAFVDDVNVTDAGRTTNRLAARRPFPTYSFDTSTTIPYSDSVNPGSANFMKWSLPASAQPSGCTASTSQTFNLVNPTTDAIDNGFFSRLFSLYMGRASFNPCNATNTPTPTVPPVYTDSDFNDWRMITIRVDPASPGANPAFYELGRLRSANEITIHNDRLGFFGTPAFAVNWGTNAANDGRVTANQVAIVALGQSIAGENALVNFPVNATDADHAENPACKGCHIQLDPFKTFFRQSYTLYYSEQLDTKVISQPAGFSFNGQTATGKGVGDVANLLIANPRYPLAWVGKLHFWANSVAVLDSDPEAVRIAEAFKASSFDYKTLVRELFSSPLVTWSRATLTTTTYGVIVSVARRDQFCSALSSRLGIADVCGMTAAKPTTAQQNIGNRALLMPVDTYYRAFALPSLPTNPDLFYRQATEAVCSLVADQVIDVAGTSKYVSTNSDAAIEDFVTTVMGLVASDPKHPQALAILKDNYAQSIAGGATATQSLKATFALACLSPSSVIVGL